MKLTESQIRQIVREELIREKVADVEPYDDVLAKVTGQNPKGGSEEYSVEVHRGSTLLIYGKGRLRARVKLGRKEAQEIAKALS
jgi:hypothetical protein